MAADAGRTILVIGGSDTGKTHYTAQLIARLQTNKSAIRLQNAPDATSAFEAPLSRLASGRLAHHTSIDRYDEIILPVVLPGNIPVDLLWPDYGGEQIRQLMETRGISHDWRRRTSRAEGWLLFIRQTLVRSYQDLATRPLDTIVPPRHDDLLEGKWSSQAWFTELLQVLLFARGLGSLIPVRSPRLAVVLSCWDEFDEPTDSTRESPSDVLRRSMPLLADFVASVWAPEAVSILGLSSLGHALSEERPDVDFQDLGPESFGYVVLPDGMRTADLANPIVWLLDKA